MKTSKFFALVGIFSLLLDSKPTNARNEQINAIDHPNYVVIGAFSIHNNAKRFVTHAHNDLNMPARLELNADRNLYYVYVLSTVDRKQAILLARRLRSESEFTDTWVYSGDLGDIISPNGGRGEDINPMTEQKMDKVSSHEQRLGQPDIASANENPKQQLPKQTLSDNNNSISTLITPTAIPVQSQPDEVKASKPLADERTSTPAKNTLDDGVAGKNFLFKLYRATDSEPVTGDVDAVDAEHSRKIASYIGNSPVRIPSPASKTSTLTLSCEVFGYRKVQREVNYNAPISDDIAEDENGNVVVPFELVRLQKGDIAVMYNVYFFKDAAVMRPESRYEVSSLLEMLKENEKYKIRIHGHTNGGAAGKIVSKGKDSDTFFSLSNTSEGYGSAKKLSAERANIIREYMVTMGIDPSRMDVKAWGGKKPIHDKHHSRAQENVRVEVEIVEDK
jgi:outer membrane protein OmpA-like peptidoglycan-associated protein